MKLLGVILLISLVISFSDSSMAESFTVTHVDDGDTIICENRDISIRVRLAGINAPELSRDKKDAGQPFSKESKLVLEKLISKKVVDVKGYGLDDYNRLLAVITSNGKDINLEMVRQGMAEVYKGRSPRGLNVEPYRRAEIEARRSLRGIWSQGDDYVSPSLWRRDNGEN